MTDKPPFPDRDRLKHQQQALIAAQRKEAERKAALLTGAKKQDSGDETRQKMVARWPGLRQFSDFLSSKKVK